MHPCIFHWWLSTQYKQGGMKMTLPPMARPTTRTRMPDAPLAGNGDLQGY
jgi:hypothetical protein